MSTPKTWDESGWPTPDQLSEWLQKCEEYERIAFCLDALSSLERESDRVLELSQGRLGGATARIEDVGPILEALGAGMFKDEWARCSTITKWKIKNDILSWALPGLDLFLAMLNAGLEAHTEYRVVYCNTQAIPFDSERDARAFAADYVGGRIEKRIATPWEKVT